MESTAQRDRHAQLGLFWESVAVPQWNDLSEPARAEAVRLLAHLLREVRAGKAGLRSEGGGDE